MSTKIPALLRALADEVEALLVLAPPAPAPAPTPVPTPEPTPLPAPEPAPEPVPVPPPAPVPVPAPAVAFEVQTQHFTKRFVSWPEAYAWQFPPYTRATGTLSAAPGARVSLVYKRIDWNGGHSACPARTYTLRLDGVEVARADVAAGQYWWQFDFSAPADPGWRAMTLGGLGDDEECVTYFFCVTGSAPALVPSVLSSLEASKYAEKFGVNVHAWTWVPLGSGPGMPTPDRFYSVAPMATVVDGRGWHYPVGNAADMPVAGDMHINAQPYLDRSGAWTTFGQQPYFWDQINGVRGETISVPLRDGPRGVGTQCFTTHVEVGRATQTDTDLTPRRNTYVCTPWSFRRVTNTGEIETLAGWRHKMTDQGPTDEPELVGDWSAIPEAERGFRLLWGMCWDSRTLAVDTTQPPVDGRPPHSGPGPRAYVADSRRNAVYRLQFPANRHAPAVITKVFSALGVWDCVEDPDTHTMLVSVRDSHQVQRVSFDGEVIETFAARDPGLAGDAAVGYRHDAWLSAGTTLAQAQAQPVLAPEGLYLQDGLLYVGSKAQAQITVFDLGSRSIVRRIPVVITGNSAFVKFAVSDGSYAPRGTVFYATFDVQEGARWYGIQPDGSRWITAVGVPYSMDEYQMSCGVGGGRLIAGGSSHGLVRHFAGDAIDGDLYAAGELEFKRGHYRLAYGAHGVGRYSVPNASAGLQYFLKINGAG